MSKRWRAAPSATRPSRAAAASAISTTGFTVCRIAGALAPDAGVVQLGASVTMGYFSQQALDVLEPDLTISLARKVTQTPKAEVEKREREWREERARMKRG